MHNPIDFDNLSDEALLRESDLVRSPRRPGAVPVLPFSSPTLWRLVSRRAFPQPYRLPGRITAWKVGEVRAWLRDWSPSCNEEPVKKQRR